MCDAGCTSAMCESGCVPLVPLRAYGCEPKEAYVRMCYWLYESIRIPRSELSRRPGVLYVRTYVRANVRTRCVSGCEPLLPLCVSGCAPQVPCVIMAVSHKYRMCYWLRAAGAAVRRLCVSGCAPQVSCVMLAAQVPCVSLAVRRWCHYVFTAVSRKLRMCCWLYESTRSPPLWLVTGRQSQCCNT